MANNCLLFTYIASFLREGLQWKACFDVLMIGVLMC